MSEETQETYDARTGEMLAEVTGQHHTISDQWKDKSEGLFEVAGEVLGWEHSKGRDWFA